MATALVFSGCQQAPQKTPEQALNDGMKNLTAVTSHQYAITFNGDLNGPQGQKPAKVTFNVALSGSADIKDMQDPKFNLKIDGTGNADDQGASASAEIRMNKDDVFFTLSKLDLKGAAQPIPKEFMDMYLAKWWKIAIPPEALKEFEANLPEYGSQEAMTPAQQKIKDLVNNTQFFKNVKYVGAESVKDVPSFHYTADLDKDAFMAFALQAAQDQGKTIADSDKKDMQDAMQKIDFTGNVWVTQDTGILNQVTGDIKFISTVPTDPTGTVSISATLWDFNKPVTVEVPTGAQDFPVQALLGGILGGGDAPTDNSGAAGMMAPTDTSGMAPTDGSGAAMMVPPTGAGMMPTSTDSMMSQQVTP